MENLFDYATKELSQDAFLRWFFANFNDKQIGPIVVDFINHFSKGQRSDRPQFNLKFGDITDVKTFAQVNDIDVSIDFRSKVFDGHRTIVIEDKTDSEEHNQLETYNKAISTWKYGDKRTPEQCVYKIFYKTHAIGEEEIKRVVNAGWAPFGIDEIYDFFIRYLDKTGSDVLNDYIKHIKKIHTCYKTISPKPAEEWNSINWETFFNKFMEKHSGVEHNFTSYRGIYDSMLVYFDIKNNSYLTYVAFEIQIRNRLIPYLHPGLHIGDKWEWSISAFESNDEYNQCKKELDELRSFVDKTGSLIKRANTARAFGKIDENIELDLSSDELMNGLDKWVSELKRIIDLYNLEKTK